MKFAVGDVIRWEPAPHGALDGLSVTGEVVAGRLLRVLSVSGDATPLTWRGWVRKPAFSVGHLVDPSVSIGQMTLLAPGSWNADPGDEDRS